MTTNETNLGHFAAGARQHGEDQVSELFLDGENLQADASTVLITLLHEAAHGIAHDRRIKGTSRQGRYHNERNRALAVEAGLEVTQNSQFGWTLHDQLPELTRRPLPRRPEAGQPYSRGTVTQVLDLNDEPSVGHLEKARSAQQLCPSRIGGTGVEAERGPPHLINQGD